MVSSRESWLASPFNVIHMSIQCLTRKGLLTALAVVSAGSASLIPFQSAEAVSQRDALKALKHLSDKGCDIQFTAKNIKATCSNKSIVKLINPALSRSVVRVERRKKGTRLFWRIGPKKIQGLPGSQKITNTKIAGKNIYTYRSTPLDVNVRLQGNMDGKLSSKAIKNGIALIAKFSGNQTLFCEADVPGPGGFIDRACPDVVWKNPRVRLNLKFAKNLAIKETSYVKVGGKWAIGGLDKALSDKKMNNAISKASTVALRKITPTANKVIPLLIASEVKKKHPDLPQDCMKVRYQSNKLAVRIPNTSKCMAPLGLR